MVNSVLSASAVFYISTMKLHKSVIKHIDKYRKHCLWSGADLNSKKPAKAAWPMVCVPKKEGGLGVINLSVHNDALLLKFLHKFFNRADIPWVHLLWENYYSNGKLPGQFKKGSFWWRDIVKLLDSFKGLASAVIADGSTVLFRTDLWNNIVPSMAFPELFSFAKNKFISYKTIANRPNFIQNFHLPLSTQAHQQF